MAFADEESYDQVKEDGLAIVIDFHCDIWVKFNGFLNVGKYVAPGPIELLLRRGVLESFVLSDSTLVLSVRHDCLEVEAFRRLFRGIETLVRSFDWLFEAVDSTVVFTILQV